MSLPLSDSDRQTLAALLIREDELITLELLEGAFAALRRRHELRHQCGKWSLPKRRSQWACLAL
jgi:uncharacterized membrane protein YsdA (DUF1294 family)